MVITLNVTGESLDSVGKGLLSLSSYEYVSKVVDAHFEIDPGGVITTQVAKVVDGILGSLARYELMGSRVGVLVNKDTNPVLLAALIGILYNRCQDTLPLVFWREGGSCRCVDLEQCEE